MQESQIIVQIDKQEAFGNSSSRGRGVNDRDTARFPGPGTTFAKPLQSGFVVRMTPFHTHRHGQIGRTQEANIDTIHPGDRFGVLDAFQVLDLWNAEHVVVGDVAIVGTVELATAGSDRAGPLRWVAHGAGQVLSLFGSANVGKHETPRTGVQKPGNGDRVVVPGASQRDRTAGLNRAKRVCHQFHVIRRVFGIDCQPRKTCRGHGFCSQGRRQIEPGTNGRFSSV